AHVGDLISRQAYDGGWPSAPILRVPPSHPGAGARREPIAGRDARRVFTTATAVKALATYRAVPRADRAAEERKCFLPEWTHRRRSPGVALSRHARDLRNLVERFARAAGLGEAECRHAGELFAVLTARSLAEPSPWPSEQLSVLSLG